MPARCGGLWFDSGELAQVIKDSLGSMPEGQALGPARGPSHIHCIDCTTGLDVHALDEGKDPADVHLCTRCHGIWLERGQLERVQQSHVQQIVSKGINWKTWLFQFLLQLPVEYNLKPRRFPLITWIFFAANVLVMVAMLAGGKQHIAAFLGFALFPARIGEPQWFMSLLSHMFLHGGLLHIAMNMYFLYVLGDNVEDVLGRFGFIAFYLFAGICGGLVHTAMAWGDTTPMVGASGAISGVMAAYAVFFRKAKLTFMLIVFQFKLSAPFYMLIWLGLNVLGYVSDQGNVAWGAHLGGFAAGLVVALLLDKQVLERHAFVRLLRQQR